MKIGLLWEMAGVIRELRNPAICNLGAGESEKTLV
jgi:hypothetical protein